MADYYSTAVDDVTTTVALDNVWTTIATLTFDGGGSNWLCIFSAEYAHLAGNVRSSLRARVNGTLYGSSTHVTATTYFPFSAAVVVSITGSQTLDIQQTGVGAFGTYTGYCRRARILAIRTSALPDVASIYAAAETTTTSATYVTSDTLTMNAQDAEYLVIVSALHHTTAAYGWVSLLQDSATNLSVGTSWNAAIDDPRNLFMISKVTLTAGAHTFELQHKLNGAGPTSKLQYRSIIVVKLSGMNWSYVDSGTTELNGAGGTGATLVFPVSTTNTHCILHSNELENGTDYTLTIDGTTEGNSVLYSADSLNHFMSCLKVGTTYTQASVATATYSNKVLRCRIFILDLGLIVTQQKELVAPSCLPDPYDTPMIIAEILPKNDQDLGGLLEVVKANINLNAGASIDDFSIQVRDDDGSLKKRIEHFDPIYIWMSAQGMTRRFWFRIEEIETIRSEDMGNVLELSGRHYYCHICFRGRTSDVTKTNREITDIIINPTDGLLTKATEVPIISVKSSGITQSSYLEKRGRKLIDMLTELSVFASVSNDWRWKLCHGTHDLEWGIPSLHFERSNLELNQMELVINDPTWIDSGSDSREILNVHDVEYGQWGATGDSTSDDISSMAEPWGQSPGYERRVDLVSAQGQTLADVMIRSGKNPARWAVAKMPISLVPQPGMRMVTYGGDSTVPRFANINKVTYDYAYNSDTYQIDALMTLIVSGLMREYQEDTVALKSSAASTASSWQNPQVDVDKYYEGAALLDVTAASGTSPKLNAWVQEEPVNNIVLLLHCNGADASTTVEDSSTTSKTVTCVNHAQIDTAQSKFGGASLLLDGTDDSCIIPDSDDWNFGDKDFTIDFWVRFNAVPGGAAYQAIFSQGNDFDNYHALYLEAGGGNLYWTWRVVSGGTGTVTCTRQTTVVVNTWYYVACVKSSNNWMIFQGGTQVGATLTDMDIVPDFTGLFVIGELLGGGRLNGWVDDFRVTKGLARWTAAFTPPTSEAIVNNTVLLLHCDGADTNASFLDYSPMAHTVTVTGGAQYDIAQSKFGGSSLLLDGNADSLTFVDSDDWYFGADNFTIEFWIRFNTLTNAMVFAGQYVDADNYWKVWKDTNANGDKLGLFFRVGASTKANYVMASNWSVVAATWYHVAFVRSATTAYVFVNGVPQTLTETTAFGTNNVGNIAAVLEIGEQNATVNVDGWLDEFRICKGAAHYTANFNVKTVPHELFETWRFTEMTSTGMAAVKLPAHLDRYIKAYWSISGTNPSFTFSVDFRGKKPR